MTSASSPRLIGGASCRKISHETVDGSIKGQAGFSSLLPRNLPPRNGPCQVPHSSLAWPGTVGPIETDWETCIPIFSTSAGGSCWHRLSAPLQASACQRIPNPPALPFVLSAWARCLSAVSSPSRRQVTAPTMQEPTPAEVPASTPCAPARAAPHCLPPPRPLPSPHARPARPPAQGRPPPPRCPVALMPQGRCGKDPCRQNQKTTRAPPPRRRRRQC